ncbi:MAG: nucleotidyltransferase family protein [Burkholderiales bacterium]
MIVGLLLAAGRSTRFGRNKLLHAPAGAPPLAFQAARCLSALEHSLAVIPEGDATLRTLFQDIGFAVTEVASMSGDRPPGLSDSLRTGLEATPEAAAWIIALSDMPQVKATTVAAMREALAEGASIVACRYRGQRGNPVGFSNRFRDELMVLQDDQGARGLLEAHSSEVCWLDVDDPGILLDIDVPADWLRQTG